MLDPNIWLFLIRVVLGSVRVLLLLQSELLLLKKAHFVALFQGELRVFAVDAFCIDRAS